MKSKTTEKFNFNTIKDFDEHIKASIPNYDVLTKMISSMSDYFITDDSIIYDLGCSTGKLFSLIKSNCKKVGYDNSNLLPTNSQDGTFKNADLTKDFYVDNASIIYSIFTMQFLPVKSHEEYCQRIYNGLNKGGAFILCEKTYQETGYFQELFTFCHYDYKLDSFSPNEILKKQTDLRRIMKLKTEKELKELLLSVGFSDVRVFWQSFNFIGLIAVK